jgi:WD40 repeat protein
VFLFFGEAISSHWRKTMSARTFPRLWPVLGMGMLLAALAPAADPPKKDLPAPPPADKVPDGSFVPGEPRSKVLILVNAVGKGQAKPARIEFLDQGKKLESRSEHCGYRTNQAGPIGTYFIPHQECYIWDVLEGKALAHHYTADDRSGFGRWQICQAGDVELFLRYKNNRPLEESRKVVVADRKTGNELQTIGLRANAATRFNETADLEIAPDGTVMLEWNLANGGRALELCIWDLKTGQSRKKWQVPVQTACKIPPRPNMKVANGGTDELEMPRIAAWNNWQRNKPLYLSPDGKLLAVRDTARQITVWDVAEEKQVGTFEGYGLFGFSANGKCLLAIRDDKKDQSQVCLLDCQSGKETRVCDATHVGYPQAGLMALSADNTRLATYRSASNEFASENNRWGTFDWRVKPVKAAVKVWDTATGAEVYAYDGHQAGICSLAISPQGRTVASCDWAGNLHIWEIPEKPDGSMLSRKTQDDGASSTAPAAAKDDANAAARASDANAEANANAEKAATAKLVLAKQLVAGGGSKSLATKWLDEVLAKYPMTQAADEARRLLKEWKK